MRGCFFRGNPPFSSTFLAPCLAKTARSGSRQRALALGRWSSTSAGGGDVFFAEVFIAYTVCSNGASLFELQHGQAFVCELDIGAYYDLAQRLQDSRRRS